MRDRLRLATRIAAIWAVAASACIWLAFNRGVFVHTLLGSTILGYADTKHAVVYGAASTFITGWPFLALSLLSVRTLRSLRVAEVSLSILGVVLVFWLTVVSR